MNEQTEYPYDVFISYSHDDEEWVTGTLLPRLEGAGLRVCIDFRDFEPGAPSVKEMRRGIETSRKTLLILTPAYLESAWAEFEHLMLQTLDPANRERRLIPLLKAKCELPLRIVYLTYVDFTRPDRLDIAWTQLLTAMGTPHQPATAHERERIPHIFLSYSRKDTDFMRRLQADLRTEGLAVWTDETGLEPGTPIWEDAIADAIERAGCLMVILSPDAKQSIWVARELSYAEDHGVRIFPVLVRGDRRSAVPFRLTSTQLVDARRGYSGAVQTLVAAVCRHLGIEARSQQ